MESAIALGEHITWSMSRHFNQLSSHERTAGWSLQAIMAIYRGTCDPLYLDAARRIATVALREQKFDQGGAWPHLLPGDHACGHPGARGNNVFLISVLLNGLLSYYEQTNDPAVQKSIVAGAEWVLKSWDNRAGGWPYSASTTGEPFGKADAGMNSLIVEPLAYVGHLVGDERFLQVAESGFAAVVRRGPDSSGKYLAMNMNATAATMQLLQQWYAKCRADQGCSVLDGGPKP